MPKNPSELKTHLDPLIDSVWSDIRQFQEDYLSSGKGRYFQGLPTHEAPPKSDGAAVPCDKLDSKPHYQQESWNDAWLGMPPDLPFLIELNQYVDGDGVCGFFAVFTTRDNSDVAWRKCLQSGPEPWHAFPWQQIN